MVSEGTGRPGSGVQALQVVPDGAGRPGGS